MEKHLDILKQLLEWWWNKDASLFGNFDIKDHNLRRLYIYNYLKYNKQ